MPGDRSDATVWSDCSLEQLAAGFGSHAVAKQDPRQIQKRDGDQRKDEEFGDAHGRLHVLVIGGRSGTVARRIASACDLAHTYARKFWRRLLADEQRGQAFAYWLP